MTNNFSPLPVAFENMRMYEVADWTTINVEDVDFSVLSPLDPRPVSGGFQAAIKTHKSRSRWSTTIYETAGDASAASVRKIDELFMKAKG